MDSPPPRRIDRSQPVRCARRRRWAGQFRGGNAVLLTHDGYGHLSQADPSACVMQALGRYFTGLTTPPRGTTCPSDHLPFDPNFGQPALSRGVR
jgi:hypothetical protein